MSEREINKPSAEFTGGPTTYYTVTIAHPLSISDPYRAECGDIIEALNMSFAEGEAFKAIWRLCAARELGLKKANHSATYDAEKVIHYGKRMLVKEQHRKNCTDEPT
jgi:hypothetical protein